MTTQCPITQCPAATRNPGCGFHPNGLTCAHPQWRDAYRWRVHPLRSLLAVVAQVGATEWRRRVDCVQGRLAI